MFMETVCIFQFLFLILAQYYFSSSKSLTLAYGVQNLMIIFQVKNSNNYS